MFAVFFDKLIHAIFFEIGFYEGFY